MFSRPGKNSYAKFSILKEKDLILQKRFKFKRPERLIFDYSQLSVEDVNTMATKAQQQIGRQKKSQTSNARRLLRARSGNYIFKVQSRNDFYEARRNKDPIPPPGWYNISYSRTQKHSQIPDFTMQSSHEDLFKHINSSFIPESPEKPYTKVPTIIPYNKQPKHVPKIEREAVDLVYESDSFLMKKNIRKVDMKKDLPRDDKYFKPKGFSLDYEPNKEIIMRDLGRVREFDKMTKRKALFKINITPPPYDINFSATLPHEKFVALSKL